MMVQKQWTDTRSREKCKAYTVEDPRKTVERGQKGEVKGRRENELQY